MQMGQMKLEALKRANRMHFNGDRPVAPDHEHAISLEIDAGSNMPVVTAQLRAAMRDAMQPEVMNL
jgi:hypothetical protein